MTFPWGSDNLKENCSEDGSLSMEWKHDLLMDLMEYGNSDFYPFHMPGHKRRANAGFAGCFPNPFSIDITEIDGFDNLHHPEGILKEAMEQAAAIYGADQTYFLVNGSSCGVMSAVCGSVSHKGTLVMSRNCHKSAYNAVYLNRLRTKYVYPQVLPGVGIQGGLEPEEVERMLLMHPETEAVLVVSPTYDGMVSDIRTISEIVHKRGIPLLVDEAHGAHFSFGQRAGFPVSALELGADVVVQSLHKTLPSLTQTAVLHVKKGYVNQERIDRFVHMFQSSSPSYVLMASIANCIRFMADRGQEDMVMYKEHLERLRSRLKAMKRLVLVDGAEGKCGVYRMDPSKIVISAAGSGMTGVELGERLRQKYHLEMEMCGPDYVTAITTVADTDEGFDRLCAALMEIDQEIDRNRDGDKCGEVKMRIVDNGIKIGAGCGLTESAMTIAQAMDSPGTAVPLDMCGGMISKEFVYIYPPGIPLVAPGEVMTPMLLELIRSYKQQGLPVQGPADAGVEQIVTVHV